MSTKDNPGTLPTNFYLREQPTSQPFDFGKIGEVQRETTETVVTARRERGRKEGCQVILSNRLVTLSILPQMLHLANEIVCIAAICNHCYEKRKGNVL